MRRIRKQKEAQVLNSFFQKIWCVNLKRREDRREHCQRLFKHCGWDVEWVEALDTQDWPRLNFHHGGAVGASLSHARLVSRAIAEKFGNFLVFEDDLLMDKKIVELMPEYLAAVPPDWDFLYLGWIPWCTHYRKPVNQFIDRVWGMNGMQATGIRHTMFAPYLQKLLELKDHCDTCAASFQEKVNSYGVSRNLIAQGGFGSDACPHRGIWGNSVVSDFL